MLYKIYTHDYLGELSKSRVHKISKDEMLSTSLILTEILSTKGIIYIIRDIFPIDSMISFALLIWATFQMNHLGFSII